MLWGLFVHNSYIAYTNYIIVTSLKLWSSEQYMLPETIILFRQQQSICKSCFLMNKKALTEVNVLTPWTLSCGLLHAVLQFANFLLVLAHFL